MAHPLLALRDPFYWSALTVLLGTVPVLLWAYFPPRSRVKTAVAITMLVLCLPAGCYALLGTACYVGGGCP